jgi:hypothetical protein
MTSHQPVGGVRGRLQTLVPASAREAWYRFASAAVMFLFAFGLLTADSMTLWIQLVGATVTLVFAAIYATTPLRLAMYSILAPAGAILLYYGIVTDVRWALITAAVAQAFGIVTAAAKTVTVVNPDGSTVVR